MHCIYSFCLQDNLRQRIIQDVITIVVKSDRNNYQSIDRVEAKILALQICLALQEHGVEFNSEKFVLAIRQNPSVSGGMAIAQRLLNSGTIDQSDNSEMMMICMICFLWVMNVSNNVFRKMIDGWLDLLPPP